MLFSSSAPVTRVETPWGTRDTDKRGRPSPCCVRGNNILLNPKGTSPVSLVHILSIWKLTCNVYCMSPLTDVSHCRPTASTTTMTSPSRRNAYFDIFKKLPNGNTHSMQCSRSKKFSNFDSFQFFWNGTEGQRKFPLDPTISANIAFVVTRTVSQLSASCGAMAFKSDTNVHCRA